MNGKILELIFSPFFAIGLIIVCGIILLYIMYKDIIEHNKTICPICEKETKGHDPHCFIRAGKIYCVHQGNCANEFLFEDLFGERKLK